MTSTRIVTALLLAGLAAVASADPPSLVLDASDGQAPRRLTVPLFFSNGGHAINAVAFSLDFDVEWLTLDPTDADLDGVPDAVSFPNGEAQVVFVEWDPADADGELDVLLANISGLPLPEGVLMEFELTRRRTRHPASAVRFAADPPASFGNSAGQSIPGTTRVLGTDIFADGFESGDTSAWSFTRGR